MLELRFRKIASFFFYPTDFPYMRPYALTSPKGLKMMNIGNVSSADSGILGVFSIHIVFWHLSAF